MDEYYEPMTQNASPERRSRIPAYKQPRKRRRRRRFRVRNGILSCFVAIVSLGLFAALVWTAYRLRSDITSRAGLLGFLAAVLVLIGLLLGVSGVREQGRGHAAAWTGVLINLVLIVLYAMIYYLGLR